MPASEKGAHGGARNGAGRKLSAAPKQPLNVSKVAADVAALLPAKGRTKYVEAAIRLYAASLAPAPAAS